MVKLKKRQPSPRVLGELEQEVMNIVWSNKHVSVRYVYEALRKKRKIAYTTVMTVMDRLFAKQVLKRYKEGKTYFYLSDKTKEVFLEKASEAIVSSLVNDFGDVAITQFLNTLDQVDPQKLSQLKKRLKSK